jgi:hypothetical protein
MDSSVTEDVTMRQAHRLAPLCLLASVLTAAGADKQPVPTKPDQDLIRTRVKTLFKAEYAKGDRVAGIVLAAKLLERAAEEKESPATRYVMLTEAITLATKGGVLELAMRAALQIDLEFNDPQLKDAIAATFAESYGCKGRLDDLRTVAAAELSRPATAADQAQLGQKWLGIAKEIRSDLRLPALWRGRTWLCEAMSHPDLKGLARTEVEKSCQEATAEIDRADARNRLFTLYEGKWVIKYDNNYTHEYVIKADGSLAFDRGISPDGTAFVKKEEQTAKLVRRGGVVVASFANGTVLERYFLDGEKLIVERFIPASNFPRIPKNRGEGIREK